MVRTSLLALLVCLLLAGCVQPTQGPAPAPDEAHDPAPSPYVGLETRPLKALSDEDVRKLLAGEGMSYALSAELNRHPGPAHVLDMAEHLALTAQQRAEVEAIRDEMRAKAKDLGARMVALETELDDLFAEERAQPSEVERVARLIGDVEGQLRAVHLNAHIETRALLSDEQVERYDAMRGYGEGGAHESHGH